MTSRTLSALALACLLAVSATSAVVAQDPLTIADVDGNEVLIEDISNVATLGGVFTETVYALGAQEHIGAVDASSFYPPEALEEKPNFGYYRFLSAEPVLAQGPSLIIGNDETGPPEVVQQLRDAGVPILLLPDNNDVQAARDLITTLGAIFAREAEAQALIAELDADVEAAEALVAQATNSPRVLFILQPPDAPMLVSGEISAAGSMITLAGGSHVFPGFRGYIPMTPEGIAGSAPEVILTTEKLGRAAGRLGRVPGIPRHRPDPGRRERPHRGHGGPLPHGLRAQDGRRHRRPGEVAAPGARAIANATAKLLVLAVVLVAAVVVAMGLGAVAISPPEVLAILLGQVGLEQVGGLQRAPGDRAHGHPHPARARDRPRRRGLGQPRAWPCRGSTAHPWPIRRWWVSAAGPRWEPRWARPSRSRWASWPATRAPCSSWRAAFVAALVAAAIVYRVAASSGRVVVATMLLAGIALSAMFAALTALIVAAGRTPELGSVAFWTLGSFAGIVGRDVVVSAIVVVPAVFLLARLGPRLDALALGESEARHLGIDVPRLTLVVSGLIALLTAVAVATAGVIAFVALIVPSLVRGWLGQSHRGVAIGAALLGATFLVIADVLARSLFSPVELSIGVITTLVGAPFFLWLLLHERGLLAR